MLKITNISPKMPQKCDNDVTNALYGEIRVKSPISAVFSFENYQKIENHSKNYYQKFLKKIFQKFSKNFKKNFSKIFQKFFDFFWGPKKFFSSIGAREKFELAY